MRLINFGLGEVSDRLSILALKILHGEAAGKDAEHWKNERNALIAKLGARTVNGNWIEAYTELAAVNATLWQGEDTLRGLRNLREAARAQWTGAGKTYQESVAEVAIRLQELNDRRAQLIESINKDAGEHLGSEKLT